MPIYNDTIMLQETPRWLDVAGCPKPWLRAGAAISSEMHPQPMTRLAQRLALFSRVSCGVSGLEPRLGARSQTTLPATSILGVGWLAAVQRLIGSRVAAKGRCILCGSGMPLPRLHPS